MSRSAHLAQRLAVIAALGTTVAMLVVRAPSIGDTLHRLGHPQLGFLLAACLAQLLSLLAYAWLAGSLLDRRGVRVGLWPLLRTTLSGIALSASLPGGAAASVVYWHRRLVRSGATTASAAYAMFWSMAAGAATLGLLVGTGIVVAGADGPLAGVQLPLLVALGALGLVALLSTRALRTCAARFSARLFPDTTAGARAERSTLAVGAAALLNWLFDLATLYLAVKAVGASVPLESILLIYGIGQIVQSVPFLPGGGGTVEATLALGFTSFGHTTGSVLAGVVLYRVINTWGLIPLGWTAMLFDSRRTIVLVRGHRPRVALR
jgi:uncharacterized membrane protein YbhN (UPF0104 family)